MTKITEHCRASSEGFDGSSCQIVGMKILTAVTLTALSSVSADRVGDWIDEMSVEEKVVYLQGAGSEYCNEIGRRRPC